MNQLSKLQKFLPALGSGLLLGATLPPLFWFPFAYIGFIPLFWFLDKDNTNTKDAFWGGLLSGIVYFSILSLTLLKLSAWWWFPNGDFFEYRYLIYDAIIVIAIIICSLSMGIAAIVHKKILRTQYSVFLIPLFWTIADLVRSKIMFGFTWGNLGYNLVGSLYTLQIAKIVSLYGAAFIIILHNLLCFIVIKKIILARKETPDAKKIFLTLATKPLAPLSLIAFWLIIFFFGFSTLTKHPRGTKQISVAVVALNLTTEQSIPEADHILALLTTAAKKSDVVVLPENTFPLLLLNEETHLPAEQKNNYSYQWQLFEKIQKISRDFPKTTFVIGIHSTVENKRHNSAVTFQNGEVTSLYSKKIPLPFGEKPLWFQKNHIEPIDAGSGGTLLFPFGRSDAFICSEVDQFEKNNEATIPLIVSPSNDSTFDGEGLADYHHRMAQFLAVEHSMYVLRSVKGGIASIIAPNGQILSQSAYNAEEILYGTVILP